MRVTMTAAILGLALAGSVAATTGPARAQVVVVGPPVAFGYSDGYWDHDHHWRRWRNEREASEWRREHHEHYYAWRHDRDHDHCWHDNDRWWNGR